MNMGQHFGHRLREMAKLRADIDRLLPRNKIIGFHKCREGELYVPQDELSKMTMRLLERAMLLSRMEWHSAMLLKISRPDAGVIVLNCQEVPLELIQNLLTRRLNELFPSIRRILRS